jgi:protoheme IX farnesyltransferase
MLKKIGDYFQLTKPRIMLLVVITGATALLIERSLIHEPFRFFLVLVALYLTGGCANALNQYFERGIDAKMTRTSNRRPLPQKKISHMGALLFSISIGVIGVLIFGFVFNWYTAFLSLGTILFYSLIYTLLLKPNTPQNIVIGGIAGAMAPVGAWVAATGEMAITPWILFAIIFFWTPPHFWALALFYKDDYYKSQLPMMPIVKGNTKTLRQIVVYSAILVASTLALYFEGAGWIYLIIATILGVYFLKHALIAFKTRSEKQYKKLFAYSIIYLFLIFVAVVADNLLQHNLNIY